MDVHPISTRQQGVSLIESLVALFVLSIGMLGIGSLMLASLQDTRGSMFRTKAVVMAWDMLERMRANSESADEYEADWDTVVVSSMTCAATNSVTVPAACTGQQLADFDVSQWRAVLQATATGIPGGEGRISVDNTTSRPTIQVQVRWIDGIVNGMEDQQVVTVETML